MDIQLCLNQTKGERLVHRSWNPKITLRNHVYYMIGIEHGNFTPFSNIRGDPTEKLAQLHNILDQRLTEPLGSIHCMDLVCGLIPEILEDVDLDSHGYHRHCYQRFHANLNRLKVSETSALSALTKAKHHSPRKQSAAMDAAGLCASPVFSRECIFCENLEIKAYGKTERPVKFASWKHKESAWQQIEPQALLGKLGNTRLHRQIIGKDLHTVEAQCHPYCRAKFRREYQSHIRAKERAEKRIVGTEQTRQVAAHEEAFNSVVDILNTHVIEWNEVMQLSSLRLIYVDKLEENEYPNSEYRSEKPMHRLQNHDISCNISFTKVSPDNKGCVSFILIYNNTTTVADAVICAYRLGSIDKLADVAFLMRGLIQRAYQESEELPWLPTAEQQLPKELIRFLNIAMEGKCEKTRRLVLSIGQDLCRAVTDGQWKLPKHILLCSTIRHMYRSKKLTIILNKLGHCESYDFGLELETAMAKAIDEVSTCQHPRSLLVKAKPYFIERGQPQQDSHQCPWNKCCQQCWWHYDSRDKTWL